MSGTLDAATFQARTVGILASPDGSRAYVPGIRLTDRWLNRYELVASAARPPYAIKRNGALDPVTGGVSFLGVQNTGQLYQWTKPGQVYLADVNGAWSTAPDPTKPVPVPVPPPAGSIFRVASSQIFDPSGKPFRARGVNVCYRRLWGDNQVDIGRVSLAALRRAYPGLNFVRFACHWENPLPAASDPTVVGWINDLTAAGIVVLVDLHVTGNALGPSNSVANDWLSDYSAAWKGNPRVWFDVQNEPHGSGSDISATMLGQYLAVRRGGSPNPVLLCTGNPGSEITGMNPGDFTNMVNAGFDTHCYGWMTSQWPTVVSNLGRFLSADGPLPVICAEFGDGGGSDAQDGNWVQNTQQALAVPSGFAAWMVNWQMSPADCLWAPPLDGSVINQGYGRMVADAINTG